MESQTHTQGRGRPTKYKPEYADQLIQYFEEYLKEPYTKEVVSKTTKYYSNGVVKECDEQYKVFPKGVPTIFGFSRKIKIDDTTLERWAKKRIGDEPEPGKADERAFAYPEFRRAYKKALQYQTEFFNITASSGMGSATWAIFAAKNMIGWRNKDEMGFTDAKGNDLKGIVVLPSRINDSAAKEEYYKQEGLDPKTGLKSPYAEVPAV